LLRKGNRDLQLQIDTALAEMESNGTLMHLQQRWQVQTAV
jgi:hypothetical protein